MFPRISCTLNQRVGMLKNVVTDTRIIRIKGVEAAGDQRKRVYFIAAHQFQKNQHPAVP